MSGAVSAFGGVVSLTVMAAQGEREESEVGAGVLDGDAEVR